MTALDWLTVILSVASLAIAMWAALKANRLSTDDLRISRRSELHAFLLEIDRELLHDPRLYGMFKSCPIDMPKSDDPLLLAKQDIYVAMYLNLFEMAFAQFKDLRGMTQAEREISEAWGSFVVSFFEDCTRARPVWERYRNTYYVSFQDYVNRLIAKSQKSAS
jgi:hypothetical protein